MIQRSFFLTILFFLLFIADHNIHAQQTVLFSPYDKPTAQLIDLIKQAKKSIYAAVYMITDKEIAQALIQAHERGIDVRIITDIVSTGKYGKADFLAENGVCVYILDVNANQEDLTKKHDLLDSKEIKIEESFAPHHNKDFQSKTSGEERWFSSDPIMHHKFVIIDEKCLWTGSFNWTVAANRKNHENIITTTNRNLCNAYCLHFSKMMENGSCKPYYPGRILTYMPSSLAGKILAAINQIKEESVLKEELHAILEKHELCTLRT